MGKPRLTVFENRMLNRTSGPKWDEVMGQWKNLHNEDLHKLYSSFIKYYCGNQIKGG
jgi:hypothetical protein